MQVEIINTGSELMLGRVLNTHQQWLCRQLADLGHVVTRQVAVADSGEAIQQAVRESLTRADLIITTGGLGPTSDDITRERIAELLGKKLIHHPEVEAHIEQFFARRGRPRPAKTTVETFAPEGARVFLNATGTAPGLAMKIESPAGGDANFQVASFSPRWLILLPGPPRELRPMFATFVAPLIRQEFAATSFVCRTLRTSGLGESRVQEALEASLEPWVQKGLEIGYCARPGAVDVRLTASGESAEKLVAGGAALVQKTLGENIYGFDDEEIEDVLVQELRARGKTLALAESCTGGLVAGLLTQVPGSSAVLDRGFVTYSNQAKQDMLGVPLSLLETHGAVSAAVAISMAEGALFHSRADLALAITGIAGPGGGSPQKPVGLVHFALAARGQPTQPLERRFGELGRTEVRWAALEQALQMLHKGVSEKAGSA